MRHHEPLVFFTALIMVNFLPTVISGPNAAQVESIVKGSDVSLSRAGNDTGPEGLYGGIVSYDDVALIVNDNSETSREIGSYFAQRRGLPSENIINISVPAKETINPGEFDDLADQVSENLSERGLTGKINYLVTTKGVPLRVRDSSWRALSVDSGLMLVDSEYEPYTHNRYWFTNPFFQDVPPEEMVHFSREEFGIRLVTRLTGYTKEEAMRLVDLSEDSYGIRGSALLDMDPRKGISQGGYGVGNLWMYNANTWLVNNGHDSHLDNNNTFVTDWENTSAYFSWGSNDGSWAREHVTNGGFESGNGETPSGWDLLHWNDGLVERTTEDADSGSWSLKLTNSSIAYQRVDLDYDDHRYYIQGSARLQDVSSGLRLYVLGYDSQGDRTFYQELVNSTGTRDWRTYQDPVENHTGTVRLKFGVQLTGTGTAYVDNIRVRVIRPHNEWVPGGIAETCVSTGGRSQTYGTWYGQSLIADLIRDGVTGVKGYAFEPFLTAISHADILFPAYYYGHSLAESFWMGSEYASWMGYVVGDPKCTPYINERADMGFSDDIEPVQTYVDEEGVPFLNITLFNKGGREISGGLVEVYMDDLGKLTHFRADIPAGETTVLDISSSKFPINGEHIFKVVLNSDGEIWEMDGTNNEIEIQVHVNRVPEMEIEVPSTDIGRTGEKNFNIHVTDGDGDLSYDNLNIQVVDLRMRSYPVKLNSTSGNSSDSNYVVSFVPPWNATIGYFTVEVTYTDPQGSSAYDEAVNSFKVLNREPSVSGELSVTNITRGGEFYLDLIWGDPDTPDGSLIIEVEAERASGGRILPSDIQRTDNNSARYYFTIPVTDLSQVWTVGAYVEDRDGATASWSDYLRVDNLFPSVELVEGEGQVIDRTGSARFVLMYHDPEGLRSDNFDVALYGPVGSSNPTLVFEKGFTPFSDEMIVMVVPGTGMELGTYSLMVDYEDDEGSGGRFEVGDALHVVNLIPVIGNISMEIPAVSQDRPDTMFRGGTAAFEIEVEDPDGTSWDLGLDAELLLSSGEPYRSVAMDRKGDGSYRGRVQTDGSWPVDTYSLRVVAADPDEGSDNATFENIFVLDAQLPSIDEGSIYVDQNGKVEIEVMTGVTLGSSLPESVWVVLFDENEDNLGTVELDDAAGFGKWEGETEIEGTPVASAVRITDDLGREVWYNDSLEIEVEDPVQIEDRSDKEEGDGSGPFLQILLIIITISLVALVVILLLVIRKRSRSRMIPAPPMASLRDTQNKGTLPGSDRPVLPPATGPEKDEIGPGYASTSAPPLPPGKELLDGSSYHRPKDQDVGRGPDKDLNRPSMAGKTGAPDENASRVQVDGINSQGRSHQVNAVQVENEPANRSEPSTGAAPVPSAEGRNTTSGVEGTVKDVRDTDDTQLPGDTGQGFQKGGQGQGQ